MIPPHKDYEYWACPDGNGQCDESDEHHVPCRGGCGDLFRQSTYTYISSPRTGRYTKVDFYYDHGVKENGLENKCPEDVSGPFPCNHTRYSCQTPTCPNDANHLIEGECGSHKVRKGDTAAVAAHAAVGKPCPVPYIYPSGYTIGCLIYIEHKCDEHEFHDYDPGSGTNPPPDGYNNNGNSNSDSTPDCSYCTDGCSSCDGSSDDSDSGYTAPSPPSEPSMVRCGASSWTGCSGASSRRAHYVPSCSNCNNSYWTCNPEHGSVKHEVTHTCTRPGCGASYTRCSKGDGTCSGGRYIWHN